jgi:alkaline phosphatase
MTARTWYLVFAWSACLPFSASAEDHARFLQAQAVDSGVADWGHWGTQPAKYSAWTTHSNRLIPVYTFGISLEPVAGKNSVYRRPDDIAKLYGHVPDGTHNPDAEYFDQTDIFRLQEQAATAGKKYIVLLIFDGMDWETTWAAAVHAKGAVAYRSGRGTGLHIQDYRGAPTDFGFFVTSPHNEGTNTDVNAQVVQNPGGELGGGYDWRKAGATPWGRAPDPDYPISKSRTEPHAYTDSAASATSMCSGIKTYNGAINMDSRGEQTVPVGRRMQERGLSVGVVTRVHLSDATTASAYCNNVNRSDYQDLTRDALGLPSIAHRDRPLAGLDVVLTAGWGEHRDEDATQGDNFVPGNPLITAADLSKIDAAGGGKYRVVQRMAGKPGQEVLSTAADEAVAHKQRLFGLFGVKGGHLPYATADGNFDPAPSATAGAEVYSEGDLRENPTLADMTRAALKVLSTNPRGFWLMVESGDVDWANHANNIDNSIGSVKSGDDAFRAITDWVEANQAWADTAVIITADHGHYFMLEKPEMIAGKGT